MKKLFDCNFFVLLWKNFLLRKRRTVLVRLAIEIIWPLSFFIITASIRAKVPRSFEPNCFFAERHLISGGLVPFFNSIMCQFDDACYRESVDSVDFFKQNPIRHLKTISKYVNLKLENFSTIQQSLNWTQIHSIDDNFDLGSFACQNTVKWLKKLAKMKDQEANKPNIDDNESNSTTSNLDFGQIFEKLNSYEMCPNGTGGCFCPNLAGLLPSLPQDMSLFLTIMKPIISGKILFAPNVPAFNRIITKANSTFTRIETLKNLFADLVQFFNQTGFEASTLNGDPNLAEFNSFFQGIKFLNNLLTCVELNKFSGFQDEQTAVEAGLSLMKNDTFWALVVFNSSTVNSSLIQYKIRMNASRTQDTDTFRDQFYSYGPRNCLTCNPYFLHGFIYIQDLLERAMVELTTGDELDLGVSTQMNPYPCYISDKFLLDISKSLPLFMVIAWVYTVSTLVKEIVYEKEKRLKDFMNIAGLSNSTNKLAWFVTSFFVTFFINVLVCVILKFGNIIIYSNFWTLLLFFTCFQLATISQCFLISTFFDQSSLASIVAGIAYLLLYLPYGLLSNLGDSVARWHKFVASFSSNVAFSFGCELMANLELQNDGAQWSNFFSTPINTDLNLASICGMLLFDSVIYMVFAVYIEAVAPGEFGVARKWFFPFTQQLQSNSDANKSSKNWLSSKKSCPKTDTKSTDIEMIELEKGNQAGIELSNLHKIYKRGCNHALKGLTVNFYKDEISALLGHNGAGKSSLIHILTGLYKPTMGTVRINNVDMSRDLSGARKSLGFVPQTDILFSTLTVWEHLWFYSMIKGVTANAARDQIEQMLTDSELEPYRNRQARALSGGLRRKLSIAIAFMGDARVVILDEPTASVDYDGRQGVWRMLLKLKRPDRTILICTHQIEEVEELCDRCAVLQDGRLVAFGTPNFLKKSSQCGYILTFERVESSDDAGELPIDTKLISLVSSRIKEAKLIESSRFQVKFSIPASAEHTREYANVMREFEDAMGDLGMESIGLLEASIDDVLVRFAKPDGNVPRKGQNERFSCSQAWNFLTNRKKNNAVSPITKPEKKVEERENSEQTLKGYLPRTKQQFKALIIKRYHRVKRNVKSFLAEIILPLVFICLGVFVLNFAPEIRNKPALELHLWNFQPLSNNSIFFKHGKQAENLETRIWKSFQTRPGPGTRCLLNHQIASQTSSERSIFLDCQKKDFVFLSSSANSNKNQTIHPNCNCTTGFHKCDRDSDNYQIQKYLLKTRDLMYELNDTNVQEWLLHTELNQEFYLNRFGGFEFLERDEKSQANLSQLKKMLIFLLSSMRASNSTTLADKYGDFIQNTPWIPKHRVKIWYNNKGYHANVALLNTLNNALIRINSSENAGIVSINHPMSLTKAEYMNELDRRLVIDLSSAIFIIFALSFVPASFLVFLVEERKSNSKHLQFVCGLPPYLYWIANFIWDLINYAPSALLSLAIFKIFNARSFISSENFPCVCLLIFAYGFAIVPFMYPFNFMFRSPGNSYVLSSCLNVFIGVGTMTITTVLKIVNKSNLQLFVVSDILKKVFKIVFPHYCLGQGLLDLSLLYSTAEIKQSLGLSSSYNPFEFELVGENLIYMVIQGFVYFSLNMLIQYRFFVRDGCKFASESNSETNKPDRFYVKFIQLSKTYKKFFSRKPTQAVKELSLGLKRGECFGLLGRNGAGKSTTFKMLTGEVPISHGDIIVNGASVRNQLTKVYESLGYCPQNDALFCLLTPREHLFFYCMLRGIPEHSIEIVSDSILKRFDLLASADILSSDLSEGNKRRLSTSIALIGNPSVICLDEPTSGMDAHVKSQLRKDISDIVNEDRLVILTSHDVAECELLCNRIGLMENGQFKFLGSPYELKRQFQSWFKLRIWIRQSTKPADMDRLKEFLSESFEKGSILQIRSNFLDYKIPQKSTKLSEIFQKIETNRQHLPLEDYSIGQSSLNDAISCPK